MTQLLASVLDTREAETVIQAGADIVDLKNPHSGALGALPIERIECIVQQVAGRRPVSATIGDLPPDPLRLTDAILRTAASGVNYVKVGFFSNHNLHDCLRSMAGITAKQALVAVLFADRQPPLQRLSDFAAAGFRGIMLDTADKQRGQLLGHIGPAELERFVTDARGLGLFSGLAGSLRLQDIPRLLHLRPDYLGFRGALCQRRDRVEAVIPHQVLAIRHAVSGHPAPSGSAEAELLEPCPHDRYL